MLVYTGSSGPAYLELGWPILVYSGSSGPLCFGGPVMVSYRVSQ